MRFLFAELEDMDTGAAPIRKHKVKPDAAEVLEPGECRSTYHHHVLRLWNGYVAVCTVCRGHGPVVQPWRPKAAGEESLLFEDGTEAERDRLLTPLYEDLGVQMAMARVDHWRAGSDGLRCGKCLGVVVHATWRDDDGQ